MLENLITAFTALPRNLHLDNISSFLLSNIFSKYEIVSLNQLNIFLHPIQSLFSNDYLCGKQLGDEVLESTVKNVLAVISSGIELIHNQENYSQKMYMGSVIKNYMSVISNILTYQKTIYETPYVYSSPLITGYFAKIENYVDYFPKTVISNNNTSQMSAFVDVISERSLFSLIEIKRNVYDWNEITNTASSVILVNHNDIDTCQNQMMKGHINISIPITNPSLDLSYQCVS